MRAKFFSGGFSLVEVVLAIGIVSFAVLSTFGLLSVANDTNRRARDDQASAQLVQNEFQRIRSLSSVNFPTASYQPQYYDSNLTDLGSTIGPTAFYRVEMTITPYPTPTPPSPPAVAAELIFNAEVHYPANAPTPNQTVARFTTSIYSPL